MCITFAKATLKKRFTETPPNVDFRKFDNVKIKNVA